MHLDHKIFSNSVLLLQLLACEDERDIHQHGLSVIAQLRPTCPITVGGTFDSVRKMI